MHVYINSKDSSGSMWTYDLTDHIMVDLKMVMVLAIMASMVGSNSYELHSTSNEIDFQDFIEQLLSISPYKY